MKEREKADWEVAMRLSCDDGGDLTERKKGSNARTVKFFFFSLLDFFCRDSLLFLRSVSSLLFHLILVCAAFCFLLSPPVNYPTSRFQPRRAKFRVV